MPSELPLIIRRKLQRLARLLRFYAALHGIAILLLTAILLFALNLALDKFFEFPLAVRFIFLPILTGTILYTIWQCIIRRCFAEIRTDQLASAIEHFVPKLNETLITTIDQQNNDDVNPELIRQTLDKTVSSLRGVDVRRFFRTGRIFSLFAISLLCVALTAGACTYHSETVSLWFSRNILLSNEEYPRRSQLLADGFQDGRTRIGRGDSFTLSIRANMEMPLVPETLRVRIGTPDAGYRTLLIDQFRTELQDNTRWRVFSATFPEMLETVNLQIRGADSTLEGLSIEVVPTPMLTEMMLTQHFPEYMQRPERTVALTGRTAIPDGTAITITAQATKPLRDATADVHGARGASLAHATGSVDISLTLPALREETSIEFRLTDLDSLSNRQPIRTELNIIRDQPPIVTARLDGIGPAITPEAVLPMLGEIIDDNGLAQAHIRYATQPESDETPPTEGTVSLSGLTPGQTIWPLSQTFSVLPTGAVPGDKLLLYIEASDAFDLDDSTGQTGTSQRWLLEIVTPEQLKTLLETREITLRQRFEIVMGEVERTQAILQDFALEPLPTQIQQAEALLLESHENESEESLAQRRRELEERRQRILDTINIDQAELGRFHISRMLRDTHKEVYDLTNIVESFRLIRAEMINNRIFTEDERRRIDLEIMQPIQSLMNMDFADIDRSLGILEGLLLQSEAANRPLALEERRRILGMFAELLQKMSAIRDRMASMESFHEVLELLRSIIRQQQILRNETVEERNRRLLDLLD
ncbi:MAG: hypothetical protein FWG73_01000 [Planctomycetaceae bacterium]|nr:hypothetical protein [Planctomycetaceae bacterium]